MIKILSERPECFEFGYPFKPPAIKTFISGIKSNIQKLRSGKLPKDRISYVARDIEGSILESKYMEIIRTNEPEFQTLVKQIVSDTMTHKEWLDQKMKQADEKGISSKDAFVSPG